MRASSGLVTIAGWCFAEDLPAPPPVRLVTAAGIVPHRARHPPGYRGIVFHPSRRGGVGFILPGPSRRGASRAFEAQRPDGTWQAFKQLSLVVEPAPFAAALDEPIRQGLLRDRVKVGGWAYAGSAPIAELSLRYGHREMPCDTGLPRGDVPALFPGAAEVDRCGFRSRDFLRAGHGPVRVRARLASGRIAIAPTNVVFSVASDENHPAELDLTVPRVGLGADNAPSPPSASSPVPTARPLNVLFVLHGDFASNSALQVAALANELAAAGHACVVAVPDDLTTFAYHHRPAFRGVTFAEAERGLVFEMAAGPTSSMRGPRAKTSAC